MIAEFLFTGFNIFVEINNITLFQQLILRNDDAELKEYAAHECLYDLFKYVGSRLPGVSILNCQVDKESLEERSLISKDFIVNHIKYGTIYFPEQIETKVSYLLDLEKYLRLEKVEPLSKEEFSNILDNRNIQLNFNLVHGFSQLTPEEVSNLQIGDVVMFSKEFAPHLIAINCGQVYLRFKLDETRIIFQGMCKC